MKISRQSQKSTSFSAGGFDAPWPKSSPDEAQAKARHFLILDCGVALAVSVIAIGQFVVSGNPAALDMSPAYRFGQSAQPEAVCSVTSGVCEMASYAEAG